MGDAPPYVVPDSDAIRAGPWTTVADGERRRLPEVLPNWDVSSSLTLERDLSFDSAELRRAEMPDGARFKILVTYESDFNGVVTAIEFELGDSGETPVSIQATIPGRLLGDLVRFATVVTLSNSLPRRDGPSVWRQGSVIWRDEKRVRLHGDSSRFPVAVVDFAALGLDTRLPWHLDLDPDLSAPAMGAIQLLINQRFERVVEAAQDQDESRVDLNAIRSVLSADLGRTMIEHLLVTDEGRTEWPEDSLGDVLRALLGSRFRESRTNLEAERVNQPSEWRDRLASSFYLMHGIG